MILRCKSSDIPELCTGICQPDTNTGCHRTLERSDALGPNHWICAAGAGDSDDQTKVPDHWIIDGEKDDVADYGGRFDYHRQFRGPGKS